MVEMELDRVAIDPPKKPRLAQQCCSLTPQPGDWKG